MPDELWKDLSQQSGNGPSPGAISNPIKEQRFARQSGTNAHRLAAGFQCRSNLVA